nr:ribonuclease H-like domain-containing protein [Tanacetum cinerariifolium]
MSDHEEETINEENAHPKVIPHITTVTNISAKFPYLKKEEYDIWAMKMQNFISSSDLLCWNIVLKGNSAKSITTDNDGTLKIHPPVTTEEHQQARFVGNVESKKMQKSLLKQKFKEFKIFEEEDWIKITTVTNISAKFPYLKKEEYDIWAMKMQNFISSSDLLCWNIVLKGNSAKSMTTDNDGNLKIRPHVTAEEHQQVQREEKARTILLSTLPDEHMGDFYHMIDARDI